jgi:23S rRNA (cytosine1962-C5)-methyltransferase
VYSNEIDTERSALRGVEPGAPARFLAGQKCLGYGYINPHSLISGRLLERGEPSYATASLLVHRLNIALSLRQRLFDQPYYRLVFGESDGLPGLVLDRFDDLVVGQIGTAGMERLRPEIEAAVKQVVGPKTLLWKNDSAVRQIEGLTEEVVCAFGEVPDRVAVPEQGLQLSSSVLDGQKTGWFYDQTANRERLAPLVRGRRVLDVFSYVGAWGLVSAQCGASDVTCVDSSAWALRQLADSALANDLAGTVRAEQSDAFDFLKQAAAEKQRWDVVIVDPPAFIKRKKDGKAGAEAYRRINELALRVLSSDGVLISCSCSMHYPAERLEDMLRAAGRHLDRDVQFLTTLQQGPDHPVHPAIPETRYLKGVIARVTHR